MLNIESYRILKEIQSLHNKIKDHEKNILEQKKRLEFIEQQKSSKKQRLNELSEKNNILSSVIAKQENKLHNWSAQLEKAKSVIQTVKTQQQLVALEEEITHLTPQINNLEDNLLEEIDQQEAIQKEIKELEGFLSGIDQTKSEIQKEVDEDCKKEQKALDQYKSRIELLWEQIPSILQLHYQKLGQKYPNRLAAIVNSNCSCCGLLIGKTAQSNLDKFLNVEVCPGCHRIFLPYQVSSAV